MVGVLFVIKFGPSRQLHHSIQHLSETSLTFLECHQSTMIWESFFLRSRQSPFPLTGHMIVLFTSFLAPLRIRGVYSISGLERGAKETYINDSLAAGIILPLSSPADAGFFFVEKKDKTVRPCIDYRGLNNITVKYRYPLPLMTTAFELLQGARVFAKLDLRNAYHLVRIREGDEWKTAFNTPVGHYEHLVMPFGLTNAPAVFQTLVNDVFRDMLNRYVLVYLDDILIFSRSMEEHIRHVKVVLPRLLENSLFVKAEKCEFHVSSVSFLGYIVAQGSLVSC